MLGVTVGGADSNNIWYRNAYAGRRTDPRVLALSPPHATTEIVAGAFGLRGPMLTFACACATGANAVGEAADLVRLGHADAVLTGGSEAVFAPLWYGLLRARLISAIGARPFSADRDGLSPGEGSGMLVVTTEDLAAAAGLKPLAEIRGFGMSSDAHHRTAPDPSGAGVARAIRAALLSAAITGDQVDYVNAHGTGTELNDVAEVRAVRLALEEHAENVPISSVKGGIGHLGGAAGAVEAIVTVKALEEQVLPPTAAYSVPDPACDLDCVPAARPARINAAISNNFGFGGANACLVLARSGAFEPPPSLQPAPVEITGLAALLPVNPTWRDGVARLDFDPGAEVTRADQRHVDRLGLISLVAARRALAASGMPPQGAEYDGMGVVLGTGLGPMESHEEFGRPMLEEGVNAVSPTLLPNQVQNAAAGLVSLRLRALGPTSTISSGLAAGAAALAYSADQVGLGRATSLVWITADTLTEWVAGWYRDQGLLAGMRLSEGAVAAVLEPVGASRRRGQAALAEIVAWGAAGDGLGLGLADPTGAALERHADRPRARLSPGRGDRSGLGCVLRPRRYRRGRIRRHRARLRRAPAAGAAAGRARRADGRRGGRTPARGTAGWPSGARTDQLRRVWRLLSLDPHPAAAELNRFRLPLK